MIIIIFPRPLAARAARAARVARVVRVVRLEASGMAGVGLGHLGLARVI